MPSAVHNQSLHFGLIRQSFHRSPPLRWPVHHPWQNSGFLHSPLTLFRTLHTSSYSHHIPPCPFHTRQDPCHIFPFRPRIPSALFRTFLFRRRISVSLPSASSLHHPALSLQLQAPPLLPSLYHSASLWRPGSDPLLHVPCRTR